MEKLIGYAAAVIVAGGALWYFWEQHDAAKVQEGIQKQIDANVAKANQNIAERRVTDEKFDKNDARAMCVDVYHLQWVFDNVANKSYCSGR